MRSKTDKFIMRMLNLFKQENKFINIELFLDDPEHEWILRDNRVLECFSLVINILSKNSTIKPFLTNTLFIKSNGTYACAVSGSKNVIIIYPELISIMKSIDRLESVAILLHECGHLILKHNKRKITNSMAQIEADLFACELGYGKYLYNFLKKRSYDPQIQNRLQAIEYVLKKES